MSQEAYTCQQCKQPLILHPSVADISQDETESLLSKLPPPQTSDHVPAEVKLAGLKTSKESKRAYLTGLRSLEAAGNTGESFVLLGGGSVPLPKEHALRSKDDQHPGHDLPTSLLETLSARSAVDHPLCSECARILQETLQAKLEDLTKERDAYIGFEKDWTERLQLAKARAASGGTSAAETGAPNQGKGAGRRPPLNAEEYSELSEQKEELERERQVLMRELIEAEQEEKRLEEEDESLAQEEADLEREEEEFLHAYHEAQANDRRIRQELQTEKTLLLIASQALARLESTNVYNDIFQIGHVPLLPPSGTTQSTSAPTATTNAIMVAATTGTGQTVGTINGLRLGGRPWVDWVEINAALGLVALCIDRMAVKVGCTFKGYKILPLGSFSRVDELPPSKNSYELYASTDISAARFLQNRRFNYALVGMLDCLRQLVEHQRDRSRGWGGSGLEIQKDRIAGHSIRLNANMGMSSIGLGGTAASTEAEESWTKALRAVLAVLKRILVIESEADREAVD